MAYQFPPAIEASINAADYPTAMRAAWLIMWYDNGGTEHDVVQGYEKMFNHFDAAKRAEVEAELAKLTPDQLEDLCCSCEEDSEDWPTVSSDTEDLLNCIFGEWPL